MKIFGTVIVSFSEYNKKFLDEELDVKEQQTRYLNYLKNISKKHYDYYKKMFKKENE